LLRLASESGNQAAKVASANVSNENPKKGDMVKIVTFASGGKALYTYSIQFDPPNIITAISDKATQDGIIREEILIPNTVTKNSEVSFKILVKDSVGSIQTYDEKTKKLAIKVE
jgi:hypothetical protein